MALGSYPLTLAMNHAFPQLKPVFSLFATPVFASPSHRPRLCDQSIHRTPILLVASCAYAWPRARPGVRRAAFQDSMYCRCKGSRRCIRVYIPKALRIRCLRAPQATIILTSGNDNFNLRQRYFLLSANFDSLLDMTGSGLGQALNAKLRHATPRCLRRSKATE